MAGAGNDADGVTDPTRNAEADEANARHEADRAPSEEEDVLAEESTGELERTGTAKSVAEHHAEMDRRGAQAKGEGRID